MICRYVGPPVDVWSMGVILYALICGHLPWNGESECDITHNSIRVSIQRVVLQDDSLLFAKGIYEAPDTLSYSVRDLIQKMLNPNPRERITIEEIRMHQWINEGFKYVEIEVGLSL
jgi:MAP/microtubule affinity-regulating kinase